LVGAIDLSNGFLFPATEHGKVERVQPVRPGIAGVEFQSLLVLSLASGKIPVVLHIVAAQNSMGIGQGRVQLQRLAGGSIGFWIVFAGTATSKASQCAIAIGQTHICQSVAGVFRDGLIEIGNCGSEVLSLARNFSAMSPAICCCNEMISALLPL